MFSSEIDNLEKYYLKKYKVGEKEWLAGKYVVKDGKKVFERGKWIIKTPFECVFVRNDNYNEIRVTVPPGFESDGATGIPDWGNYWVIHDYLYKYKQLGYWGHLELKKEDADKIGEIVLDYEINQVQSPILRTFLAKAKEVLRKPYNVLSRRNWVENDVNCY